MLLLALLSLANAANPPKPNLAIEFQYVGTAFPPHEERAILSCPSDVSKPCLLQFLVGATGDPLEGAPTAVGVFETSVPYPRALAWSEKIARLQKDTKFPPEKVNPYTETTAPVRFVRAIGGTLEKEIIGSWYDASGEQTGLVSLWNELRTTGLKGPKFAVKLSCRREKSKSQTSDVLNVSCNLENVGTQLVVLPLFYQQQVEVFSIARKQSLAFSTSRYESQMPKVGTIPVGKKLAFGFVARPREKLKPQEPLRVSMDLRKDPASGAVQETGTVLRALLYSNEVR